MYGSLSRRALAALLFALPVAAGATSLHQAALFTALHGGGSARLDEASLAGIRLEGVEMHYADQVLKVTALRAHLDDSTKAEGIRIEAPLVMDEDFFRAPITGVVRAFLREAEIRVDRLDMSWSTPSQANVQESMAVKEVLLATLNGRFAMTGRSIVSIHAVGTTAWNAPEKEVVATVEEVKAAGLGVPLGLAFGLMAKFLNAEFVALDNPDIVLDVAYFLQ